MTKDAHAATIRLNELVEKVNNGDIFTPGDLNEIRQIARGLFTPTVVALIDSLCAQALPKPDVETYRKVVEEYIKHIAEKGIEPDPEAAMAYLDGQAEYEAIKKASGLG